MMTVTTTKVTRPEVIDGSVYGHVVFLVKNEVSPVAYLAV